jgi:hypothetical protein
LAVGADLHLVAEPHVMLDVLAGHADIVGDLVDLIALLGAGEDSGPAQPVDGRMVGVVRIDVPIVFLDLGADPFLPAAADASGVRSLTDTMPQVSCASKRRMVTS